MNPTLPENHIPHRWRVILTGHIDDLELAVIAIQENLHGAWIGFLQDGDDDQAKITITLKWLDPGMQQMVRDIIDTDHDQVRIIFNGGVNRRGERIKL